MKVLTIELLEVAKKNYLKLKSKKEKSTLRQIMAQIIRKYNSNCPVTFISKAAQLKAKGINLFDMNWHEQNKFDKGRLIYHLEHKTTISDIIDLILQGEDVSDVVNKIEFGWILKEEDKVLNEKGYRSKRLEHNEAYKECGIDIVKPNSSEN
tara:strand:+ start:821 stop:1276 length:456 start_codon:yes stop_codon:yes gene_type:complete